MSPSELPKFTIQSIHEDRCSGQFDASKWVGENWPTALYLDRGRFLWGRLREVDDSSGTCSFVPDQLAELSALRAGESYSFIDSYWGERAELVLDEGRDWQRTVFEASDMVMFRNPDGTSLGTRSSSDASDGGNFVPGGWDHEHCEICWGKIGAGGDTEGYHSTPNAWICKKCYDSFVLPRSVAFVI